MDGQSQAVFIEKGWGIYVNQDFTRLAVDTPIEITEKRGCQVFGYIAGDPNSKLGFMRPARIHVCADLRSIKGLD